MDHRTQPFERAARTIIACVAATCILSSCATVPPPRPDEPGPPQSYGAQRCAISEAPVYEATAAALARMEEPDLGFLEPEVIICAFLQAFDGGDARNEWLAMFSARVMDLSRGAVRLERTDHERFRLRMHGAAAYLVLVRGEQRQRLILGPYARPVQFVYE